MPAIDAPSGLSAPAIAAIRQVFARHANIEQAILYGSRATGRYRPGSDIDLALLGDALTLDELLRIEGELDDLMLPYRIDLSILQRIENVALLDHIRRVGIPFK